MKTQLRILTLVAGLLGSSMTMAYSSDIALGGASAKPGEILAVDLSKLHPHIDYKITCHLKNDALTPSVSQTDAIIFGEYPRFYIDAKEVTAGLPFLFNSTGVTFEATDVRKDHTRSLYIRNLDNTDSISLTNCLAVIMHQN